MQYPVKLDEILKLLSEHEDVVTDLEKYWHINALISAYFMGYNRYDFWYDERNSTAFHGSGTIITNDGLIRYAKTVDNWLKDRNLLHKNTPVTFEYTLSPYSDIMTLDNVDFGYICKARRPIFGLMNDDKWEVEFSHNSDHIAKLGATLQIIEILKQNEENNDDD